MLLSLAMGQALQVFLLGVSIGCSLRAGEGGLEEEGEEARGMSGVGC